MTYNSAICKSVTFFQGICQEKSPKKDGRIISHKFKIGINRANGAKTTEKQVYQVCVALMHGTK